ncbi:MAG: septum formation initiator family protein [Phycisphaerae bacterium]|nr:septum formation initiator family protein [Gemmatimonadaceae bacterium]
MPPKRNRPRWRVLLNRAVVAALACGLVWFALEGGEYGTRALFAQRDRKAALEADVEQLKQEVDSLQKEKTLVLKNDAVLERIAREQYGMLKGSKEILFWMNEERPATDSSVLRDTASRTLSRR